MFVRSRCGRKVAWGVRSAVILLVKSGLNKVRMTSASIIARPVRVR